MITRFQFFAYSAMVFIFSTLSVVSHAGEVLYKVEKAGYVNSPLGSVEAICRPGDQLVTGSCEGKWRSISIPLGERRPLPFDQGYNEAVVEYPLVTETENGVYRCKPKMLRPDQHLLLIIAATCRPSQT